jgi:hypothetical protein
MRDAVPNGAGDYSEMTRSSLQPGVSSEIPWGELHNFLRDLTPRGRILDTEKDSASY